MCDNLLTNADIKPIDEATNRNESIKQMRRGSFRLDEVKEDTYTISRGRSQRNVSRSFTPSCSTIARGGKSTTNASRSATSSPSLLGQCTYADSSTMVSSPSGSLSKETLSSMISSLSEKAESVVTYSKDQIQLTKGTSAKVVSEGTNLMKTIQFPTVICKVSPTSLQRSTVYYVKLVSESGEFVGEIPGLMFSSPYFSSKRTHLAELLPLCVEKPEDNPEQISVTPMLLQSCYKRMFSKGCSFKIKAIESGRHVDWSDEYPWNVWNLSSKDLQGMLTQIIYKDVRQMPKKMVKALTPLHVVGRERTVISRPAKVPSLADCVSKGSDKYPLDSGDCKLSDYCSNLKFSGVGAKGVSSFADWFKVLPANVRVDKDFKCDYGTTLSSDMFSDMQMFEKYLCISDTI